MADDADAAISKSKTHGIQSLLYMASMIPAGIRQGKRSLRAGWVAEWISFNLRMDTQLVFLLLF
jgi:hypothetical protein